MAKAACRAAEEPTVTQHRSTAHRAPGRGAAQGGLDYWQMMEIFEAVAARAPICGFNMVEFMPSRDVNEQGALMASRLGLSMLGMMAQQIASRDA